MRYHRLFYRPGSQPIGHLHRLTRELLAPDAGCYRVIEETEKKRYQNSLFRSRDWLSANQGPVFPDSVGSCEIYLRRNTKISVISLRVSRLNLTGCIVGTHLSKLMPEYKSVLRSVFEEKEEMVCATIKKKSSKITFKPSATPAYLYGKLLSTNHVRNRPNQEILVT
eukprot:sb/3472384/